mmetsp:Transcript_9472/g.14535  ORF Transcript_9472/g.14535 Transcript_9472/m.14535 type:complete len:196 (-) Transcript_9472:188-775(-)|eukprot:CAMPEP_0113939932 /NCGR_PEP_ID=MMETSP1339-20121228/6149_1 /TAXON_ID=94617 /ORGANISM="Fibrocapsa japonica" /LENGTH=195 /DNA_ID=CAMNT_0000943579 /DNA_START=108 /DNA_END=695 /DNA_ORIENTATION=- /assembly_acc=CAM_ASM_000762
MAEFAASDAPAASNTEEAGDCVKLVSQDGDSFTVPKLVAQNSVLVKTMMDETTDDDSTEEPEIPLPNVKSSVLAKVIEFCKHYVEEPMSEIPKPIKFGKQVKDVVQPWFGEFVNGVDYVMLFELILAANYLDIKALLDITCARVGLLIMNKTPDEIRNLFGITEPFSPELETQLREENKWSTEPPCDGQRVFIPI